MSTRLIVLAAPTPLVLNYGAYRGSFDRTRDQAAADLEPVITAMNTARLTGAGFQVTIENGVRFEDHPAHPAVAEKLLIARDVIRPASPAAAAAFPNALIIYRGAGIELFGGEGAPAAIMAADLQALCYQPGHTGVLVTRGDIPEFDLRSSWGQMVPGIIGGRPATFYTEVTDRRVIFETVNAHGCAYVLASDSSLAAARSPR
jgi:hypothetical protein